MRLAMFPVHRLLWMLALVAACGVPAPADPEVPARLGRAFSLRTGQRASVEEGALLLRFEAVPEDSRCPTEVQCPWEGNARVRLQIHVAGGDARQLVLNTALEPRRATVFDHSIELLRLDPAPTAGETLPQERYTALLRVTRAE